MKRLETERRHTLWITYVTGSQIYTFLKKIKLLKTFKKLKFALFIETDQIWAFKIYLHN